MTGVILANAITQSSVDQTTIIGPPAGSTPDNIVTVGKSITKAGTGWGFLLGQGSIAPSTTTFNPGGTVTIATINWSQTNEQVTLQATGGSGNNDGFDEVMIGSQTFVRTDAAFTSPDFWTWTVVPISPFGMIEEVEIPIFWDIPA